MVAAHFSPAESNRDMVSTMMPHSNSSPQLSRQSEAPELEDPELQSMVTQLENLQAQQRSPQQPNLQLDAMILQLIDQRPERRQRMAIMTKSALLRKKILSVIPKGTRAGGCAVLGATHEWRKAMPDSYSDCNWPKAVHNHIGVHYLPGGQAHHDRLLRSPSDKRTLHPLLQSSAFYSFPRTRRFPTSETSEVKPGVPGPGTYMKSVPSGTAPSPDGGETIILGANNAYPWKRAMGRHLNPIEADATTLDSAPCYTFPKTRRTVADTFAGHGLKDGGPVKTDTGCLSPGFYTELHSTMQPIYGTRTLDGTQSCVRRKYRKRLGGHIKPRVRCYPMNGEAEGTHSDAA
mmetsp:Transcript_64910/g.103286  ORF Transcript_64910/g.103286 Transcript_64910/m.103286 type:complete len:347 (-) Transcript_64910:29-1069(-)